MITELTKPNLEAAPLTVLDAARNLNVENVEDAKVAHRFYSMITDLKKKVTDHYTPILEPARAAARAVSSAMKEHNILLDDAEEVVRLKVEEYVNNGGTLPGNFQARSYSEVQIDDVTLIPREFLTPDEKAIKKVLEIGGKVPGARLVERIRVAFLAEK